MQTGFAAALLDPDTAPPPGLIGPGGLAGPKRFAVYRNTVTASLTRALEAAFPTLRRLLGEAFFGAMAVVYLRAHPPTSPQLALYGDTMADFLGSFPPVAHLGYLPDVARLDQAIRESYHAADSIPLSTVEFQRLIAIDSAALRLRLQPALRLVRSAWPLHSIWVANHAGGPTPLPGPEDIVVLRPEFDPVPYKLPQGGGAFLASLLEGRSLGESLAATNDGFDLTTTLGILIAGRAITGVHE